MLSAKLMESQRPGAKMLKKQRDTSKDIGITKQSLYYQYYNAPCASVSRSKLPGKSPSDLLKEHQRSLPFLGRGTRPGDLVHFPNTSTSLAKVSVQNNCVLYYRNCSFQFSYCILPLFPIQFTVLYYTNVLCILGKCG